LYLFMNCDLLHVISTRGYLKSSSGSAESERGGWWMHWIDDINFIWFIKM